MILLHICVLLVLFFSVVYCECELCNMHHIVVLWMCSLKDFGLPYKIISLGGIKYDVIWYNSHFFLFFVNQQIYPGYKVYITKCQWGQKICKLHGKVHVFTKCHNLTYGLFKNIFHIKILWFACLILISKVDKPVFSIFHFNLTFTHTACQFVCMCHICVHIPDTVANLSYAFNMLLFVNVHQPNPKVKEPCCD